MLLRAALDTVRAGMSKPIDLNFFAYVTPVGDPARQAAWRARLARRMSSAALTESLAGLAISARG